MNASYAQPLDEAFGARRSLARLSDVFGQKKAPTALAPSIAGFFKEINDARPADVPDGIGTLAGAALGGFMFRDKHPVLGVIGGASIGRNLTALMNNDLRKLALRNLVATGAGVAGSIYMPKHPILGFLGGSILGGAAAYFSGLK